MPLWQNQSCLIACATGPILPFPTKQVLNRVILGVSSGHGTFLFEHSSTPKICLCGGRTLPLATQDCGTCSQSKLLHLGFGLLAKQSLCVVLLPFDQHQCAVGPPGFAKCTGV